MTQLKYRADIDGLRAIAVLSVVGFHAFPFWIQGGFIGVDIFFVISGFLITTLILTQLKINTFSLIEFYGRRIKRIFPALLLVLTASYAFGWFVLLADEYKQLGKHIAGGAAFISNFLFWKENGYFDNAAETKPLLHLWSLGVEEQFYILWPLLLWFSWKQRLNLLSMAIAVAFMSFVLSIALVRGDPVAAFYLPQTRFWELLTGAILACSIPHWESVFLKLTQQCHSEGGFIPRRWTPEATGNTVKNVQSMAGALLITVGILVITKEQMFPGWWVLLPTMGTILIISAGSQAWLNRTVLSNRVLVGLGLISFPLYLWHWPLLSFARVLTNETPSRAVRVVVVVVSIVLAYLTYELIERPLRVGQYAKQKIIALVILMTGMGYVGYNSYQRDGLQFRVKGFTQITKAAGEWQYPGNMRQFTYKDRIFYYQKSNSLKTTLFVGDSNIEQYYPRINELIGKYPNATNGVIFSTGGGCVPIPGARADTHERCFDLLEKSLELALSRVDISTVVIGGLWFQYLSGDAPRYFYSGTEKFPVKNGSMGYRKSLIALSDYIKVLKLNGKKVFLVLNIPIGKELDPKSMAQRSIRDFPNVWKIRDGGISLKALEEKYGFITKDLTDVANISQAILIDPIKYLCKNDICPNMDVGHEPIYKDDVHLRPRFVRDRVYFVDSTVYN